MGQCFFIANLDRKEVILPQRWASGMKLYALSDDYLTGLFVLLDGASERRFEGAEYSREHPHPIIGRWAGNRVSLIGDEQGRDDIPGWEYEFVPVGFDNDSVTRIEEQKDGWVDISEYVVQTLEDVYGLRRISERVRRWYEQEQRPFPTSRSILHPDGTITPRFGAELREPMTAHILIATHDHLAHLGETINGVLGLALQHSRDERLTPDHERPYWGQWYEQEGDRLWAHFEAISWPQDWDEVTPVRYDYVLSLQPLNVTTWEGWDAWIDTVAKPAFEALKVLKGHLLLVVDHDTILDEYVPTGSVTST